MIKAGGKVILGSGLGRSIVVVVEVIETVAGKYYKLKDRNDIYSEDQVIEILPEKKDGLYVTVGYDPELIKGVRDTISEAVCELQEYATNEHSYYTADGKEMLSTWKQKGDHVYDVHTFEKVSPSNWKQLS